MRKQRRLLSAKRNFSAQRNKRSSSPTLPPARVSLDRIIVRSIIFGAELNFERGGLLDVTKGPLVVGLHRGVECPELEQQASNFAAIDAYWRKLRLHHLRWEGSQYFAQYVLRELLREA
jgi:hypothetical protein